MLRAETTTSATTLGVLTHTNKHTLQFFYLATNPHHSILILFHWKIPNYFEKHSQLNVNDMLHIVRQTIIKH